MLSHVLRILAYQNRFKSFYDGILKLKKDWSHNFKLVFGLINNHLDFLQLTQILIRLKIMQQIHRIRISIWIQIISEHSTDFNLKSICIPESFIPIISHKLFYFKLTFMISQCENTNSKGDFVVKNRFEIFGFKIQNIQK